VVRALFLDNLFATVESRRPFIEAAKAQGAKVRCVLMETSIEDAQINALCRMMEKYGRVFFTADDLKCPEAKRDSNSFPIAVLFKFRKDFEKPSTGEGLSEIKGVPFSRLWDTSFTNSAYIFDYDGTLRDTKSGAKFPTDPDDVEILPGRKQKLAALASTGVHLLGVSNQSLIAKGELTDASAQACFDRTNELLGVDIDYCYCPHRVPPITCYSRKPQSGFGVHLIYKYKLDPTKVVFVGDQGTDKSFARRLGFSYFDEKVFFGD